MLLTVRDFLSVRLRKELVKVITSDKDFSSSVLLLLRDFTEWFPSPEKATLFMKLKELCLQKKSDRSELLETIGCYLPNDRRERELLLNSQLAELSADGADPGVALAVIQALLAGIGHEKLIPVFTDILSCLSTHASDPVPFLEVLASVIKALGSRLAPECFSKFLSSIVPLFQSCPKVLERFLPDIVRSLANENKRALFHHVCKFGLGSKDGYALLCSIFLTMYPNSVDLANQELSQIWNLFFTNGSEDLAGLLLSVSIESGDADGFFERCSPHFSSMPVLSLVRQFLDRVEATLGLSQSEMGMNRFVTDEDFIVISFVGDITETVYVLDDCSYDRILALGARLAKCRCDDLRLRVTGEKLSRQSWSPKSGLVIHAQRRSDRAFCSIPTSLAPGAVLSATAGDLLLSLLTSEDKSLAVLAFTLLNAIPPLHGRERLSDAPSWDEVFRQPPLLLLYDLHSLAHFISKDRGDWGIHFCQTGGASRLLSFVVVEADRVYDRGCFLSLLGIAELLLSKLPQGGVSLPADKLLSLILRQEDPAILRRYCKILLAVASDSVFENSALVAVLEKIFLSDDPGIRSAASELMPKLSPVRQQEVLLSVLPAAFVETSDDFFRYFTVFAPLSPSPLDLWERLLPILFDKFSSTVGDPLVRLRLPIPCLEA
jgi:hypothetical protein